jgi:hypothetical protein
VNLHPTSQADPVPGSRLDNKQLFSDVLVFLHLPKTAGRTLLGILERNYGLGAVLGLYDSTFGDEVAALTPEQVGRIRIIAGHFYFGVHDYLSRPCRYLTFLRDPVERVISHYHFVQRQPAHYLHEAASTLSLPEYVRFCGAREPNNDQTRLLAGREMASDDGTCSPLMLPIAKRNLDSHAAVGLTEAFDVSLVFMQHVFGWRQPLYLRQNVDVSGSTAEGVAPEAREVIEEFNALDLELYGHGRDRFERLVAQQGCAFSRKVRAFQHLNALYGKANRLRSLRVGRPAARRA